MGLLRRHLVPRRRRTIHHSRCHAHSLSRKCEEWSTGQGYGRYIKGYTATIRPGHTQFQSLGPGAEHAQVLAGGNLSEPGSPDAGASSKTHKSQWKRPRVVGERCQRKETRREQILRHQLFFILLQLQLRRALNRVLGDSQTVVSSAAECPQQTSGLGHTSKGRGQGQERKRQEELARKNSETLSR